ncbi:DUF1445 domain-containing protein [Bisporella sp. PMI_857]|nr:DUF1445 domain-containing protein [Bisporella sp. PMI_857]
MPVILPTGIDVRLSARNSTFTAPTTGLAPSYLQANLIILPSRYASDFRDLCARNPVPCPLIAESSAPGAWSKLNSNLPGITSSRLAPDLDLRRDAPRYNVYHDSSLVKCGVTDIEAEWTDDHVAFVIGCSFSFEAALAEAGLEPRHAAMGRNVPMYRTNIPLCPSGVFTGGTYVVSMRPYRKADIEKVRAITRHYLPTHGECIAWGWSAVVQLGIGDIDSPEWGDAPLTFGGRPLGEREGNEENIPVFWGCGVTPQEAVMRAGLEGTVMAHAPGHMLVLDVKDNEILRTG